MTQQQEKNPPVQKAGEEEPYEIENIEEILTMEQRDRIEMSFSDKIADKITAFSGSMLYVGIHVVWFVLWLLINAGWFHIPAFDPFPFSLLTLIVSLEAIFLASFVLISQNKQAVQADKRAKTDLLVNMIAERETTKLIEMIAEIQKAMGIHKQGDEQEREMDKTVDVNKLADVLDEAERKISGSQTVTPRSAADTSH